MMPSWFKAWSRRIRLMIARAVLNATDDTAGLQNVQLNVLSNETVDDIERVQNYGFSSHALSGAEAIALSLSGERSSMVVINIDDRRFRIKNLASGEVAIYTDEGDVIHFKRGNEILINTANKLTIVASNQVDVTSPLINIVASTKVTMTTPECVISGKLTVGAAINAVGQINSTTGISTGAIELGTHVHPENNVNGGTTGGPQ